VSERQLHNIFSSLQTLSTFGVLGALECTLAIEDSLIKAASVDILGFFVEFSPSMVRDYMMQQRHKVDEVNIRYCYYPYIAYLH